MFISSYIHLFLPFHTLFVALGILQRKDPLVQNANELILFTIRFEMLLLRLLSGSLGCEVFVSGRSLGVKERSIALPPFLSPAPLNRNSSHSFKAIQRQSSQEGVRCFWLCFCFLASRRLRRKWICSSEIRPDCFFIPNPGLDDAHRGGSDAAVHLFCLRVCVKQVLCSSSLMIQVRKKQKKKEKKKENSLGLWLKWVHLKSDVT